MILDSISQLLKKRALLENRLRNQREEASNHKRYVLRFTRKHVLVIAATAIPLVYFMWDNKKTHALIRGVKQIQQIVWWATLFISKRMG